MTFINKHLSILFVIFVFAIASASGQTERKGDTATAAPSPTTQTVNAQQGGAWTVGVDPEKNTVKLANTPGDPLAVKVVNSGSARKPFQFRMIVSPTNTATSSQVYQIPAGKRLVIENVSAIARMPQGMKMEMNFFCYYDNGDGIGDQSDITFHRIALVDQGYIEPYQFATANHKVLVFADQQIGGVPFNLVVQARLSGPVAAAAAQGQFTFSGYIEDLPTAP